MVGERAAVHSRVFEAFDPTSDDHPFAAVGRAVTETADEWSTAGRAAAESTAKATATA